MAEEEKVLNAAWAIPMLKWQFFNKLDEYFYDKYENDAIVKFIEEEKQSRLQSLQEALSLLENIGSYFDLQLAFWDNYPPSWQQDFPDLYKIFCGILSENATQTQNSEKIIQKTLVCQALIKRTSDDARKFCPPWMSAEQSPIDFNDKLDKKNPNSVDYVLTMKDLIMAKIDWPTAVSNKYSEAICYIQTAIGTGGTGFLVKYKDKYFVLTCKHLFNDCSSRCATILQSSGKWVLENKLFSEFYIKTGETALSQQRPDIDLLFYYIDDEIVAQYINNVSEGDFIEILDETGSLVAKGIKCCLLGNLFGIGKQLRICEGMVESSTDDALIHTAKSQPGDSGSPIFTADMRLLGVNTGELNEKKLDNSAKSNEFKAIPITKIIKCFTEYITLNHKRGNKL